MHNAGLLYFLRFSYNKSYYGRHRISQWRSQKRTFLDLSCYCMIFRNRVYEKCESSGSKERKVVQGRIKCVFPIAADKSHIQ